jgi:hypothetical protein
MNMQKVCRVSRTAVIFVLAAAMVCSATLLAAQSKPNSIFQILKVPAFTGDSVLAMSTTATNNIWTINTNSTSLHFDGTTWTQQAMTTPIGIPEGVAAISSSNAWAVGLNLNNVSGVVSEIVENFNGKEWVVVPDVDLIGKDFVDNGVDEGIVNDEFLTSISSISANDIFAGGFVETDIVIAPFVEHWDGTKWSLTPSLPIHNGANETDLNGISALSDTDVWAVGFTNINALAGTPESWHFDGKKWTEIDGAPNCFCAFTSVTAIAANDIWAVGYQLFPNGGFFGIPMAQHFNGTKWTLTPIPSPNFSIDVGQVPLRVAAVSSTSVFAVSGRLDPYTFLGQPFVEHWNGSHWSLELLPLCPLNVQECGVSGVAALPTGEVWAAGGSNNIDHPGNPFVLFTTKGK